MSDKDLATRPDSQLDVNQYLSNTIEQLLPLLPDRRDGTFPLSKADVMNAKMIAALTWASAQFNGNMKFADLMLLALRATLSGFDPTEIIDNLYLIPGKEGQRPKIAADVSLLQAKVLKSGILSELHIPDTEEVRKAEKATVVAVRRDNGMRVSMTFSKVDATEAGLMGKSNWKNYWPQMLINRALTMVLRKAAPDVLKGMAKYSVEEVTGDGQEIGPDGQVVTNGQHVIIDNPAPARPTNPATTIIDNLESEPIEDIDEDPGDEDVVDANADETGDIPAEFDPLAERPDVDDAPGKAAPDQPPFQWANKDAMRWIANEFYKHIKKHCEGCTTEEIKANVLEFIDIACAADTNVAFNIDDESKYPVWSETYASKDVVLKMAIAAYNEYGLPDPQEEKEPEWSETAQMNEFEQWSRAVFGLSAVDLLAKTPKKSFSELGSTASVAKQTVIMFATSEQPIPAIVYEAKYEKNRVVYKTLLGKPVYDYGAGQGQSGRDRLRALGDEWAAYAEAMGASFKSLPQPLHITVQFGNNYLAVTHVEIVQAAAAV